MIALLWKALLIHVFITVPILHVIQVFIRVTFSKNVNVGNLIA